MNDRQSEQLLKELRTIRISAEIATITFLLLFLADLCNFQF